MKSKRDNSKSTPSRVTETVWKKDHNPSIHQKGVLHTPRSYKVYNLSIFIPFLIPCMTGRASTSVRWAKRRKTSKKEVTHASKSPLPQKQASETFYHSLQRRTLTMFAHGLLNQTKERQILVSKFSLFLNRSRFGSRSRLHINIFQKAGLLILTVFRFRSLGK